MEGHVKVNSKEPVQPTYHLIANSCRNIVGHLSNSFYRTVIVLCTAVGYIYMYIYGRTVLIWSYPLTKAFLLNLRWIYIPVDFFELLYVSPWLCGELWFSQKGSVLKHSLVDLSVGIEPSLQRALGKSV